MIEIISSPEFLFAMRVSESVTADDISKASKALDEVMAKNERVSVFAEFQESAVYTLEGFFKDLGYGISKFGRRDRVYRAAVVTDQGWIAALSRVEGLMFSSINVRVFSNAQRDEGFRWASEAPEPLPAPEPVLPGVRLIHTTSDSVFAYEIEGRLADADIRAVIAGINEKFDHHEKINIIGLIKDYKGFDLGALFTDGLFSAKIRSFSKVDKYAIVGPTPWMRNFLELVSSLLPVTIKLFETDNEAAAWEWVGATQALLPESAAGA